MQPRTWLIEGKTITAPTWTQKGKPFLINRKLREIYNSQQPQKPSLAQRFRNWANGKNYKKPTQEEIEQSEESEESDSEEDSQGDGLMTLEPSDILFPEE